MVDGEWDVILIGAGQNNFALGTYLGKAGLKTVICESRLENGGRLASEEITLPGYWHNTLAYFQDNREVSPVWKELKWADGYHAEFVSPPVISVAVLAGRTDRFRTIKPLERDASPAIEKFSTQGRAVWRTTHDRFHQLIRDYLIPYYYHSAAEHGCGDLAEAGQRARRAKNLDGCGR